MNSLESPQPQNKSLFDSKFARAMGLVADLFGSIGGIIGVITFLLTLGSTDSEVIVPFLQFTLTPFHALGLWIISTYIYIGALHSFWNRIKDKDNISTEFFVSIREDFIKRFKYPFTLLPGITLIVLFAWILFEIGMIFKEAIFIIVIFTIIIGVAGLITYAEESQKPSVIETRKRDKLRQDIDKNWTNWDKKIKSTLRRRDTLYITVSDIKDMAELWEVKEDELSYALAKYASKYPGQTKYGNVYKTKDGKPVFSTPILAKVNAEWREEYFFD